MRELLKYYSIDLSFLVIGLFSSIIAMNSQENRKKTRWERFIIGLSGWGSAIFLTPLIIWLIEISVGAPIPRGAQFGIAYAIGQAGLLSSKMIFEALLKLKESKNEK